MDEMKTAIQLKNKVQARIEAIRADADLSEKKKAEMIAGAREQANKAIAALRESLTASRAAEHDTLKRQLFGLSHKATATEADKHAAITSYRAALSQVQGLASQDEARKLLQQSRMYGDTVLARAIGAVAYENGWGNLLNEYAEAAGSSSTLAELGALEQSATNRTRQFEESVAFQQIAEGSEERDARLAAGPAVLGAAPGSLDSRLRG